MSRRYLPVPTCYTPQEFRDRVKYLVEESGLAGNPTPSEEEELWQMWRNFAFKEDESRDKSEDSQGPVAGDDRPIVLATSGVPGLEKQESISGTTYHAPPVPVSQRRPRRITLEEKLCSNVKHEIKSDPRDCSETEFRGEIDSELRLASKKQAILEIGLVKQDDEQETVVHVWENHHSSIHPTISWNQLQDLIDAAEDESHVRLIITTHCPDASTSPEKHSGEPPNGSSYDRGD